MSLSEPHGNPRLRGMGTNKTPDARPGVAYKVIEPVQYHGVTPLGELGMAPPDRIVAEKDGPRCMILTPSEIWAVEDGQEKTIAHLRSLGRLVSEFEGRDVEFCDPLGQVVERLTVRRPPREERLPDWPECPMAIKCVRSAPTCPTCRRAAGLP